MKRGQVTVFIIIGIVLVALFGLIYVLLADNNVEPVPVLTTSSESGAVKKFVENCLEESSKNAIDTVASQGGYINPPHPYFTLDIFKVPYYFDKKILLQPDINIIADEINFFIEEDIGSCLTGIKEFPWKITMEEHQVKSSILEKEVFVQLNLPLTLSIGDSASTLQDFSVKMDSQLSRAINIHESILKEQEKEPNVIRLSHLMELSDESVVDIYMEHLDGTVFYYISFPEDDLVYRFAAKYYWSEEIDEE